VLCDDITDQHFFALNKESQTKVFEKTFEQLQKQIVDKKLKDGATVNVCITQGKKIVVGYAGDATTHVAYLDAKGKAVDCERVNSLHNAENQEEFLRVTSIGKTFTRDNRLEAGLAVTRALGDIGHIKTGLSNKPEVAYYEVDTKKIPLGGRVVIITACDGLTEKKDSGDDVNYLKGLINRVGIDPKQLADGCIKDGSGDNVSVMVTPVDLDSEQAKLLAVFDGHEGDKVANLLKDQFLPTFSQEHKELMLGRKNTDEKVKAKENNREKILEEAKEYRSSKIIEKAEIKKKGLECVSFLKKVENETLRELLKNGFKENFNKINPPLNFPEEIVKTVDKFVQDINNQLKKSEGLTYGKYLRLIGNDKNTPLVYYFELNSSAFPENNKPFRSDVKSDVKLEQKAEKEKFETKWPEIEKPVTKSAEKEDRPQLRIRTGRSNK
jgi:serine/threonine protein phosphatase PrpC